MSKQAVEFSYNDGVITLSTAMQRRLEKAAKKVNTDEHGFLEGALNSTMQSAIEGTD